MNKTAIKNYAIRARIQLIESAKQRAFEYEITDGGENQSTVETVGGRLLSKEEKEQRRQLIEQIRQKGYNQVMEEAAYTWFNRFIALRFMEVNGYLPSKTRVFTDENGAFKPEMLKQAMSIEIDGLDRSKVLDLIDKQDNDELFKYLLITQCNALNSGLPYMFEKIANWTELLFPANLLRNDSVIGQMISEIPEEDWTDAVQIIGWMYQYYNSELKDETFALLKKNVKITKERIPAATQLFTPDWIVRYMVENSLGRLWYEGHPDFDKSQWKYYLDEAEQEPEVEQQLKKIRAEYATIRPEEIKVIDPCMGSGHILVYAFDVLMQIYTSAGWSERDAAKSIIENNLYGLDIDDRAGQLAYFAVMMKARKYNRRILNGEVRPNVISIQESNWMTDEFIAYVAGKDSTMKADLVMLRKTFKDAKEYGSILNVPKMQYGAIYERIEEICNSYAEDIFQAQYQKRTTELLLQMVKQSQILSQKYDVVVTNPPYMGSANMGSKLIKYVQSNFPRSKYDLYTVFVEKMLGISRSHGFLGIMSSYTWMFLTSFEKYRAEILTNSTIISLIQPEYHSFFESANVPICAYVLLKHALQYNGTYIRLNDFYGAEIQAQKVLDAISEDNCSYKYISSQKDYSSIPGMPIAYWKSKKLIKSFNHGLLNNELVFRQGMTTTDNDKYLRLWQEVSVTNIGFDISNREGSVVSGKKWFPYQKGGEFRKWYGNNHYVVFYYNDGKELVELVREKYPKISDPEFIIKNRNWYFKKGLTWSTLSSGSIGVRFVPSGFIFDAKGSMAFLQKGDSILPFVGLLNSVVAMDYLDILAPTMDFNIISLKSIPFFDQIRTDEIRTMVQDNIDISKSEWDSFETSWEFKKHPLV